MARSSTVRHGIELSEHGAPFALKLLYAYTIVGAGIAGLCVLAAPTSFAEAFGVPSDPYTLGVVGAVSCAFALVAALGLRAPLAFAPVFLVQLAYKSLWIAIVFLPRAIRSSAPGYAWMLAAVFASYIVLDVIAIPFARLFAHAPQE